MREENTDAENTSSCIPEFALRFDLRSQGTCMPRDSCISWDLELASNDKMRSNMWITFPALHAPGMHV